MRILTIGGTGMLGSSIMLTNTKHELWGTYLGEKPKSNNIIELDITDEKWVKKIIKEINPDAIIHTAAITNVDLCESKPAFAKKVHIEGTNHLLRISKELGIYFLYISTDSVFDGNKGNYSEVDSPNPLNVYGKTKFDGETITLNYDNSSVIRTNIYGHNWLPKQSIAEWIRNTLKEEKEITLFKDVYFSPILVNNLTDVLIEIIERRLKGLYHVAGPEGTTKLEYGKIIAEVYNLRKDLIKSIFISQLNLKAPRPLNSTLNCSKIQAEIDTRLLNVREGLLHFKELENLGYLKKLKEL